MLAWVMLGACPTIAFALTTDPGRARDFYEKVLGLAFLREDSFALVFDANGTQLRVSMVPNHTPAEHPVFGWAVADIRTAVAGLGEAGVKFERYPFLEQDDLGIWTSPDGAAKVAFFKDPDGNVLSLTEA
jgi:catechol 2,3-dioxygenase-like lactoylglutathione lyase family enzyme